MSTTDGAVDQKLFSEDSETLIIQQFWLFALGYKLPVK